MEFPFSGMDFILKKKKLLPHSESSLFKKAEVSYDYEKKTFFSF